MLGEPSDLGNQKLPPDRMTIASNSSYILFSDLGPRAQSGLVDVELSGSASILGISDIRQ